MIGMILLNIGLLLAIWPVMIISSGIFFGLYTRDVENVFEGFVIGNIVGIVLIIIGFIASIIAWGIYLL